MTTRFFVLLGILFPLVPHAQNHDHQQMMEQQDAMMSSALLPGAPMTGDGSGTSRLPVSSQMEAIHSASGAWSFMLHGAAFPRYTSHDAFESGTRGDARFDLPNWVMGMAQHSVGSHGQVTFRTMASLDPLSEGGEGYPLLFQTGETFEGERLIDRQHPHDLFMEIGAIYAHRLGADAGAFAYVAYPGEPALGPVAFMHRPSARHYPDAPLGHHWQDATHIAWGVATAGITVGPAQIEGSIFTGREPDEDRYAFDKPRFDSFSGRISVTPTDRFALQFSGGFIKQPEAIELDVDVVRMTASALYTAPVGNEGSFSGALVWGMNSPKLNDMAAPDAEAHGNAHTILAEGDLTVGPQAFFGRVEWTEKPAEELGLGTEDVFRIGALTLGSAREIAQFGRISASIGAQGTFYVVPEDLQPLYGTSPISLEVFLRFSPAKMMQAMAGMDM